MENLVSCFTANLPAGIAPAVQEEALEAELVRFIESARAPWPMLQLHTSTFVKHVAERVVDGRLPPEAYAADLFLACGCAYGIAGAHHEFELRYAKMMVRAASRVKASPAFVDEALQRLRERLFVSTQGLPKIAEYRGRAALAAWVTLAASRAALMLRRGESRRRENTGPAAEAATHESPELVLLKRRYADDFAAAVGDAFAKLTEKERTLLELHLVGRVNIDKLGELYRVGRSTAARWLASARTALADHTRQELQTRLRLTDSEYDAIAILVQSQLDVSITTLLRAAKADV